MSKISNREDFPKGTRVMVEMADGSKRPGTIIDNADEYAARIEPDDKRDIVGLHTYVGWEFVSKLEYAMRPDAGVEIGEDGSILASARDMIGNIQALKMPRDVAVQLRDALTELLGPA